jgi:hypothetical protein
VYRERFKRGNGEQQITDTSSPVREQSRTRAMCVKNKSLWPIHL